MTSPLYIGMARPYVVRVTVPASADFDPVVAATADEVLFEIRKPNGQRSAWAASVTTSSESAITLTHNLAEPDLDQRGTWSVWVRFTMANGDVLRTAVGKLPPILNPDELR